MYIGEEKIYEKNIYLDKDIKKRSLGKYFSDCLNRIYRQHSEFNSRFSRYFK
mgnify:CR=1 FL=1